MGKFTNRLTYITKTATKIECTWSNKEVAQFHYFNPNGLIAQKRAMDDRISAAVDAGQCKTGAIIAYGIFNDYSANRMIKFAMQKRVNRIHLSTCIDMMTRDLATAEAFLASLEPAPAPQASLAVQHMIDSAAPGTFTAPEAAQEAAPAPVAVEVAPKQAPAPVAAPEPAEEVVTLTVTKAQASIIRNALRTRMSLCITQELHAGTNDEKKAWDARWSAAHDAFKACGGSI